MHASTAFGLQQNIHWGKSCQQLPLVIQEVKVRGAGTPKRKTRRCGSCISVNTGTGTAQNWNGKPWFQNNTANIYYMYHVFFKLFSSKKFFFLLSM